VKKDVVEENEKDRDKDRDVLEKEKDVLKNDK
jgi:hypothetical protein